MAIFESASFKVGISVNVALRRPVVLRCRLIKLFLNLNDRSLMIFSISNQRAASDLESSFFGVTCNLAQYHAPEHTHQACEWNLPFFSNNTEENHLSRNPKHKISCPARKKLTFHPIKRLAGR